MLAMVVNGCTIHQTKAFYVKKEKRKAINMSIKMKDVESGKHLLQMLQVILKVP